MPSNEKRWNLVITITASVKEDLLFPFLFRVQNIVAVQIQVSANVKIKQKIAKIIIELITNVTTQIEKRWMLVEDKC